MRTLGLPLIFLFGMLIVAGSLLWSTRKPTPPLSSSIPTPGQSVTLTGTYVCLPHRNPDQPHTLECAYGLAVGETNFALDTSQLSQNIILNLRTDDLITVSGVLTPAEELTDDAVYQSYDIEGVITATAIATVDNAPTPSPSVAPVP